MVRTILVIDDEPAIVTLIAHRLTLDGYRVITAHNGDDAWIIINENIPDLIILDLMLPGIPGLELLREIRQRHTMPVIVLTARKDEVDRVVGLEMGADDYVTKPFSILELAARVKAMFRRDEMHTLSHEISLHGIDLNADRREVHIHGYLTHLTSTEFEILALLLQHPGRVFSREEIFHHVWGGEIAGDTRTINVHIKNLRAKLFDAQDVLETVRSVGYRIRSV